MGLPRTAQIRLPNTAHTSRPWRIHELTRDFRLEDVWQLPGRGGPDGTPGRHLSLNDRRQRHYMFQ